MKLGKHIPLIFGISLPVLMVAFIAASIYLPGIFIKPKFDFLYADFGSYNSKFFVEKHSLAINPNFQPNYIYSNRESKLYIHDVKLNKSREITFDEAKILNLDSNLTSPDGFQITSGQRSGGIFPFFYYSDSNYSSKYLTGNNLSKKLDLNVPNYYYDFSFLGWIIK